MQLAKQESLLWKPELKTEADRISNNFSNDNIKNIEQELLSISYDRFNKTVSGINKLYNTNFIRTDSPNKIILEEGSTKILDYSIISDSGYKENEKKILLFIPSLINRPYIFDLSKKRSMISFFNKKGYKCLLVDWGKPSDSEKDYNIDDYIKRLGRILKEINNLFDSKVTLIGYCMGGVISLATAQLYSQYINNIVAIATPWDFHSSDIQNIVLSPMVKKTFFEYLDKNQTISGDFIHKIMYLTDPWSVHNKFSRISDISDTASEEYQSIIEREYWLHDNIDITNRAAKQIFLNWAINNEPILGKWYIDGIKIDPSQLNTPLYMAISKTDRIVPPLCSYPLSLLVENTQIAYPPNGHIGMVSGTTAERNFWFPLENYLNNS